MPISHEEKQTAMEAVLSSGAFARSEQLRAFLRFVCEAEMAGQASELTEYLIGTKALGRSANFSPVEDSSVRTRAYELRQRLQKFYAVECPDAPIRIELPRGSYTPRYIASEPVVSPAPPGAEPPASEESPEVPARGATPGGRRRNWLSGFVTGIVLAALAGAGVYATVRSPDADPALRRAWTPLMGKDAEVLICIGTPLHLLVTPYLGTVPDTVPHYAAPAELYGLFSRYRDLPKTAQLEMQPVQKALPLGDLESVTQVLSALQTMHVRARMLPETNSPLTALRGRSAVLFGSPWYSRSAGLLLEKTPWTTRWDDETRQVGVFGQGPRAGKRYLPVRGPHGEYQEVFGLITVLPNDTAAEGVRSIVVFSGLTSVGTHGAASFFTWGRDLKELAERFRREGFAEWPRSFQVLVRCCASNDAQLLSYRYEADDVLLR